MNDARLVAAHLLGEPLKKTYRAWFWRCLWHQDSDPSMAVYEDGYHCFGCQESGDEISLVMRAMDCNFREAVAALEKMGYATGKAIKRRETPPASSTAAWMINASQISAEAERQLYDKAGYPGRKFLDRKGIKESTARAMRVGYDIDTRSLVFPRIASATRAIRYMSIDDESTRWAQGSDATSAFGEHVLKYTPPILVVTANEMQALSVWQEAGHWLDCICGDASEIASDYLSVIHWNDPNTTQLLLTGELGGIMVAKLSELSAIYRDDAAIYQEIKETWEKIG